MESLSSRHIIVQRSKRECETVVLHLRACVNRLRRLLDKGTVIVHGSALCAHCSDNAEAHHPNTACEFEICRKKNMLVRGMWVPHSTLYVLK